MLVLVVLALCGANAVPTHDDDARFALPDDLLIGAGVSAIQTEGAWNEGGKSESAVDHALHSGKLGVLGYADSHLQDKAADSYHRFKEDVKAASELKLQLYRMSISWARVLPDAKSSNPNKEGVDYYHSLIDEILSYNMTPLVTMYHFDHPQILEEEINGWLDRKIVDKFRDYGEFLLQEYGSKVKLWTTINEPNIYCSVVQGFIEVSRGSSVEESNNLDIYPCLHNTLLAHAEVNRVFRERNYEGKLGFTVTTLLSRPVSTRPEDVYASEAYNQMFAGMLLNPLVHGDYPQMVKDIAKNKLPKFTEEEKKMLKGSTDYIGLNVYYGMQVQYKDPMKVQRDIKVPLTQLFREANFMNVGYRSPKGEDLPAFPEDMVAPDAMRSALLWTWFTYKMPIMITENGIGHAKMRGVHDRQRAYYHSTFMRAMVSTIHDFGTKIIGYCAWSLIESYEWRWGLTRDFGLVHIDYEHGSLNRTLKDSAVFWQELAERRTVPLVEYSSSSIVSVSPPLLLAAILLAQSTI